MTPTLMIVALVRPGLTVTVLKEHLNASPQQVLPAWAHCGPKRALVNLDQLAWFGKVEKTRE